MNILNSHLIAAQSAIDNPPINGSATTSGNGRRPPSARSGGPDASLPIATGPATAPSNEARLDEDGKMAPPALEHHDAFSSLKKYHYRDYLEKHRNFDV